MREVPVNTPSGPYCVKIGSGLLPALGEELRTCSKACRVLVVAGENVFPIYGETVLRSLREADYETKAAVFPAGEETKSLVRYGELLNIAAGMKLSRTDCMLALGGGVTGDLTGFAAATYQRGIPYVQVPTTLLAAVDSSVGGKTAVDLPAGKNQVGAFWQPKLVLCDTDTLCTLPERELRAGLAEVVKYAVLGDADLFDLLQHTSGIREKLPMTRIIETCVRMKAEIVEEDERDTGRRRLLNLGHSFGHAVETRSAGALLHGEAVAVGTAMICRAAARKNLLHPMAAEAVIALLREFGLPTETDFLPEELMDILLLDKKFASGKLNLIVPRSIGWCEVIPVSPEELRGWLTAGY